MEPVGVGRCVIVAGAAILAGCGGASGGGTVPAGSDSTHPFVHQQTFHYVDGPQRFRVPSDVTTITVVMRGAAGGGPNGKVVRGGRVFAVVPVKPKETLYVYVGGAGGKPGSGYDGGGSGGSEDDVGYGGGGASDIREGGRKLRYRIIVAGGGGGYGGYAYGQPAAGGAGGGKTGASGTSAASSSGGYGGGGGGGGTQRAGGNGGQNGTGSLGYGYPGAPGSLGNGGTGGAGSYSGGSGGGGGGGYYGGGGGGSGGLGTSNIGAGGGGGGGSSYVEPRATRYQMWQGWKDATSGGLVVISW